MTIKMNEIEEIASAVGMTVDVVRVIWESCAPEAKKADMVSFCFLVQQSGLSPFAGQIRLMSRKTRQQDGSYKLVWHTSVGIDGLRVVADRTENYAPGRAPEFEIDDKGNVVSATAFVKKYVKGTWHEVGHTAHFDEFAVGNSPMWRDRPRLMLAKCAEAGCLRKAFPASLSQLYTPDEISETQATVVVEEPRILNETTGEIQSSIALLNERSKILKEYRTVERECIGNVPSIEKLPETATVLDKVNAVDREIAASIARLREYVDDKECSIEALIPAVIARAASLFEEEVPADL